MGRLVGVLALAAARCAAGAAFEATVESWDKEVMKPLKDGKLNMAFVKFLAPWCGHCKSLKPDWDKLAGKFNNKDKVKALIVDVDCTMDSAKSLCETYGVEGYPTIKYFTPSGPSDGAKYEGGRDLKALTKFVNKNAKEPCDATTLKNCDKKEKTFVEEVKDKSKAELTEMLAALEKEIGDAEAAHKAAGDVFEEQKTVAMETMKKQEEAKKVLDKVRGKTGYKQKLLEAVLLPAAPAKEDAPAEGKTDL